MVDDRCAIAVAIVDTRGEPARSCMVKLCETASGAMPIQTGGGQRNVQGRRYSHSIVPGGFDVMSSTTRPTGRISLIILLAICSSRS